ncbi:MAG: glycosyltransferase, partial [Flavobacteriaceae bacterium]|nr:glycosyltransferase [Flavobacteriaceae bacterium]
MRLVSEIGQEHSVYLVGTGKKSLNRDYSFCHPISLDNNGSNLILAFRACQIFLTSFFKSPKFTIRNLNEFLSKPIKRRDIIEFNLKNLILSLSPDIVHIQWATHLLLFESSLNRNTNLPYKIIVSLRGRLINVSPNIDPIVAEIYQNLFPKVHRFHAVSQNIKREATRWGANEENINVVYSGIDLNEIIKYQKKLFLNSSSLLKILSVGRLNWKKG